MISHGPENPVHDIPNRFFYLTMRLLHFAFIVSLGMLLNRDHSPGSCVNADTKVNLPVHQFHIKYIQTDAATRVNKLHDVANSKTENTLSKQKIIMTYQSNRAGSIYGKRWDSELHASDIGNECRSMPNETMNAKCNKRIVR